MQTSRSCCVLSENKWLIFYRSISKRIDPQFTTEEIHQFLRCNENIVIFLFLLACLYLCIDRVQAVQHFRCCHYNSNLRSDGAGETCFSPPRLFILKEMMAFVRAGDTVVVESISRIVRNTRDLLSIVSELTEKSVEFVSLKENIDTTTPQGRFMLTVFGALAELERENILERQREGIEIAKSEGKYKGRKPIDYDEAQMKALCKKWRAGEITATAAMKELGLKPNTFYRRVKEMGL